jgi:cell division protein FtsQ
VLLRRPFVRGFAAVILLALLLGLGWLWARDSQFARVTNVRVTGATTSEESSIRAALEGAALEMSTLHVRRDVLDDAVSSYPSVAGLRVQADFPHDLSIEVLEHRPVAALEVHGRRVPVSGGGIVLNGVEADRGLPSIRRDASPADGRVDDARTRTAVAVAAAAPAELLARSDRLWWGPKGLMADLRDGPPLVFGSADDAAVKWAAAARVLAEPSAAGATYLDLRVPGRVAAGGLGPVPQEAPPEDPANVPQP